MCVCGVCGCPFVAWPFSLGHGTYLTYPTPRYSTWLVAPRTTPPSYPFLVRNPFTNRDPPLFLGAKGRANVLVHCVSSLCPCPSYPQLCIHASRTILPCPVLPSPRASPQLPNLWVTTPGRDFRCPLPAVTVEDDDIRVPIVIPSIRPSVPAHNPQSIGIFLRPVPSSDAHTVKGLRKRGDEIELRRNRKPQ